MQGMRRVAPAVLIVAWIVFLTLPLGFLFGAPGASSSRPLGLYASFVELIGQRPARWLFCGLWLAINGVLFWRVVLSKRRRAIGPSVDLHDY